MSVASIPPIEAGVHTANVWLKELAQELGWEDRERAYHALQVVLQSLRDRLTVDEAADLGAQLPLLIRGLYYEGWDPSSTPVKERRREVFLHHIAAAFPHDAGIYPEGIAWAVFKVLEKHVSSGEVKDVLHVLPGEIRSLWPGGEVLDAAPIVRRGPPVGEARAVAVARGGTTGASPRRIHPRASLASG